MKSPQRPRRGAHALRGPGRHRAPGPAGSGGRNLVSPLRLAAVAMLSATAVGLALTGPAALATVDVGAARPSASPGPRAGHGLAPPGSGPGTGGGAPNGSQPAGSSAVPDSPEPSDPEPVSSPEPEPEPEQKPEPAPGPEPGGVDPAPPDVGDPAGPDRAGDPVGPDRAGDPVGPGRAGDPAGPAGPAEPVEGAGTAGGDGLGPRWQDAGVAPLDPDIVKRETDDLVETDRLAATAARPAGDGRIGLLALVAAICAAGVSVGAVRVMIAQRTAAGRRA